MNYLSQKDIMNVLNIGKNKALALMTNEDFPSVKLGERWMVEEQDLKDYLKNNKQIKLDYRGISKPLGSRQRIKDKI